MHISDWSSDVCSADLAGITSRGLPAEQVVYRLYDLFGENRPTMEVTRRAVRFASGWSRERVQEAGRAAATGLALTIQPFARPIFAQHRAAGRALALATTPPSDLIAPLAAEPAIGRASCRERVCRYG